jgi:hypothetical protein
MRRRFAFASTIMFALGAFPGLAAAQQSAAPPAAQQPAAQPQPAAQQPAAKDEDNRQARDAMHSTPGRAGKDEPKMEQQAAGPVFVNGNLAVPGASQDTETTPAKFSKRNDALDKLPTMAFPLLIDDAQRQKIVESVRAANRPVAKIDPRITEVLPNSVTTYELPQDVAAAAPGVRGLKYIPLKDRILLVSAPNMVVVGEIAL